MMSLIDELVETCNDRNKRCVEKICDECPKRELCDAFYHLSYGLCDDPSRWDVDLAKKGYEVIRKWVIER